MCGFGLHCPVSSDTFYMSCIIYSHFPANIKYFTAFAKNSRGGGQMPPLPPPDCGPDWHSERSLYVDVFETAILDLAVLLSWLIVIVWPRCLKIEIINHIVVLARKRVYDCA